jgi:hypothetical protein
MASNHMCNGMWLDSMVVPLVAVKGLRQTYHLRMLNLVRLLRSLRDQNLMIGVNRS